MLEDQSYTSEDHTFLFGQGAASSTPMRKKNGQERPSEPSWASPMESPFDRIDQKLNVLKIGQHDEVDLSSQQETPSVPEGYSRQQASYSMGQMEEYDEEPSVLINRRDWDRSQGRSSAVAAPIASARAKDAATPKPPARALADAHAQPPHKASPRRPHASQNPFVNAAASSSKTGASTAAPAWNGIVDMRNTPLNPRMKKLSTGPPTSSRPFDLHDDTMDETDDEMMADLGMSPPVTMNFTMPQRNLTKTPAKEASKLILTDLMRQVGVGEEPSPQMPTPPSFAKYGGMTPGLSSGAGRRLFQEALDEDAAARVEDDDGRPQPQHADESLQDSTVDQDEDEVYREEDTYQAPRAAAYEQDTIQLGRLQPAGGAGAAGDASTTDLLHLDSDTLSPAMSEGGRVFGGGASVRGKGAFSLFGPDEMQTFHGGVRAARRPRCDGPMLMLLSSRSASRTPGPASQSPRRTAWAGRSGSSTASAPNRWPRIIMQ